MIFSDALRRMMDREIPVLSAEIGALYSKLDRQYGLQGAKVKINFVYDEDSLGSYTPAQNGEKDYFQFSLLFVARCVAKPLSKEDRRDLFLHEYAHYMQYNMDIPREYLWQPGIHGSAWKYCCSLVGAAPTPFYKVGEGLLDHDYDAVLKKKSLTDSTIPLRDNYQREKAYRATQDSIVQYKVEDEIEHPKYGRGKITEIIQQSDSVRLKIEFECGQKIIDQKWLIRNTKYRRAGSNQNIR